METCNSLMNLRGKGSEGTGRDPPKIYMHIFITYVWVETGAGKQWGSLGGGGPVIPPTNRDFFLKGIIRQTSILQMTNVGY